MDSTTHCGNKLLTNCIVGIWCQLVTALWEYYFLKKVIFQHLYPCTSWYKQRQIMLSNINFQLLFLAHPSTIACSQIGYPGPPTMLCNKFTIPPRIKLHSSFLVQKNQGILKGGIGSLFEPCVNAMGSSHIGLSCMEVSYCTFGFGTIIRCDLRTLSLSCDSPHDNLHACMI